MPFADLMRDKIDLVKKDGTLVKSGIKAQVSPSQILTFDVSNPIQPDDHLLRTLSNGVAEDYIVIDPHYQSGIGGAIKDFYKIKVRRSSEPVAPSQTIINNITAHNSQVNINSTNNTMNIVYEVPLKELTAFVEMVGSNLNGLPDKERQAVSTHLQELKTEIAKPENSGSKIKAILGSMKTIAEGTAGNLVASGIGFEIAKLLSQMNG